jgi:hypothetical protein
VQAAGDVVTCDCGPCSERRRYRILDAAIGTLPEELRKEIKQYVILSLTPFVTFHHKGPHTKVINRTLVGLTGFDVKNEYQGRYGAGPPKRGCEIKETALQSDLRKKFNQVRWALPEEIGSGIKHTWFGFLGVTSDPVIKIRLRNRPRNPVDAHALKDAIVAGMPGVDIHIEDANGSRIDA